MGYAEMVLWCVDEKLEVAMPIEALMLAEPPEAQIMPEPRSYHEARQALHLSGTILLDVIEAQPPQTSNTQLTTAEVVHGVGEGMAIIAEHTSETPGQPQPGDVQFALTLGEELQLVFGEQPYSQNSDVCHAIERLIHAGYWWQVRDEVNESTSTSMLVDRYHAAEASFASAPESDRLQGNITQAMTVVIKEMFDLSGGGKLFEELRVQWRGAESCFEYAKQAARTT